MALAVAAGLATVLTPPAGTTVLFGEALVGDVVSEHLVGGAPFNVARHLAAFLSAPLMITRIGDDHNGGAVRAEFERFAMSTSGLQLDLLEETGRVLVERHPGGQRHVLPPRQAYDFIDAARAHAAMAAVTPAAFYYGTLAQRATGSRATLHSLLADSAATRFLDLNLHSGEAERDCVSASLAAAQIVKVNEAEWQTLLRWYVASGPAPAPGSAAARAAARVLMDAFAIEALIVTLGHRGAVHVGADGAQHVQRDHPAPPFIIDTVGAGDAFAAIFLLGLVRGWPRAQTLARANEFAGAICAISGAVPDDIGFYDPWVARWQAG